MEKNGKPFFTIITSTLNVIETIERCVKSVAEQTFRNYEHIIVDGASTDGTVEFLNSRKELFSVLISEPDTGIYNAWNKALKYARGEWILFLGADDILADKNVLGDVAEFIQNQKIDKGFIYGDIILVRKDSQEEIERISTPISSLCTKRGCRMLLPERPPHPAIFHHRSLFFDVGYFDESFKILADSKFMIFAICQEKIAIHYIPLVINKMAIGGISFNINKLHFWENIKIIKDLNIKTSKTSIVYSFFRTYILFFLKLFFGDELVYKLLDLKRKASGKAPFRSK